MIVILMGVSGSGKTTVGKAIASAMEWEFSDADCFHSDAAKEKMSRGEPLTDTDRAPWLQQIGESIAQWLQEDRNVILSCSALKASYRQVLFCYHPQVHLVYLKGSYKLIEERLHNRLDHFMKADLLHSQFSTLEEPSQAEAIYIDISQDLEQIVREIRNYLII